MKSNISQARINQEIRNMLKQQLPYLKATPLENDIYTWHFTIQGPQSSDFHQGLYHGHILLPFEYPFKPPDIVFHNKNGRFQTNTKICLTITQYHPEQWNSAWTIRTMLQAVISLFSESVQGIGYQQGSPQQRKSLALKSHNYKCDKCGVLKDILKPRQPKKQEEKKQQKKQNSLLQPSQKLQYAPQLNLRKVKTEDNRNIQLKSFQKKVNQNIKSDFNKKNLNHQKIQQKNKPQPKNQNSQIKGPQIRMVYPQNDPIALDRKLQRNYITWAKVIKSQKWSVIE